MHEMVGNREGEEMGTNAIKTKNFKMFKFEQSEI